MKFQLRLGKILFALFVGFAMFAMLQAAGIGGGDPVQAAVEGIKQVDSNDIVNFGKSIIQTLSDLYISVTK